MADFKGEDFKFPDEIDDKDKGKPQETNDDDFEIPAGPISVLIDSISAQYLEGAEVDFKKTLLNESFTIKNPKAKSTCGCGSSFTPY